VNGEKVYSKISHIKTCTHTHARTHAPYIQREVAQVGIATGVKLTTHLLLVSRSRMRGAIPPSLIRLHDMLLS